MTKLLLTLCAICLMAGCDEAQPQPQPQPRPTYWTPAVKQAWEHMYDEMKLRADRECDEAKRNGVYSGDIKRDCIEIHAEIEQTRKDFEAIANEGAK